MKRYELLYEYSINEYQQQINIKKDIRNRSFSIFNLNFPIITTLCLAIISKKQMFSCLSIIFLFLSGLFLIISLVFFLLIYAPSNQLRHSISNTINECENLFESKERIKYIESLPDKKTKANYIKENCYQFFCNLYDQNIQAINSVNNKFKTYFIFLSTFISISYILLILVLVVK